MLIVEDEAPIRDGLDALFRANGFEPTSIGDGAIALELLTRERFAIAIVDLMLPGVHGLELVRAIRRRGGPTAVLVLTAAGTEDDVVAGLEAGADDYVVKPFSIRELVARAKGLLRRPNHETSRAFRIGDATLDLDALEVREGSNVVRLSAREASLIAHLAAAAPRFVPRDELLVTVWGYRDGSIRTRTVDVHVQQLRAKLAAIRGAERWIGTARGLGYRFEGTS